jgi:hypothetical protein
VHADPPCLGWDLAGPEVIQGTSERSGTLPTVPIMGLMYLLCVLYLSRGHSGYQREVRNSTYCTYNVPDVLAVSTVPVLRSFRVPARDQELYLLYL